MVRLFIDFNLKTWWRSLKGSDLAIALFFSAFLLLIFAQVIQFVIILMRAETISAVREIYPWVDDNVLLVTHLLLINSMLFIQFIYTKVSRLQLTENRKLLGLGMPFKYINRYLNAAGFLNPINLLFHLFWMIYLGLMVTSQLQLLLVLIFIPLFYGICMSIKWWFRELFEKLSGWLAAIGYIMLFVLYLFFVFSITGMELVTDDLQEIFAGMVSWLVYTPGYLVYLLFSDARSVLQVSLLIALLAIALFIIAKELQRQTAATLKSPLSSGKPGNTKSYFPWYKKLFGHEGGKSQYYIWSHPYARMQMATAFIFPVMFLYVAATAGDDSFQFMTSMFLALVPAMALILMLTNLYGFENRELLLSIQLPVTLKELIWQKIKAVIKVAGFFLLLALLVLPFYVSNPVTYLQQSAAIFFIFLFYLNFKITSSFRHYKKIEKVSLFALSSPIIPQSVSFFIFITIILFGILLFPVIESIQWLHILLILAGVAFLFFSIVRKLGKLDITFRKQLIPKLWNEL